MPKCKICKAPYIRKSDSQTVCSYECSLKYAQKNYEKKAKEKRVKIFREKKAFKDSDKKVLKELAQKLFNQFIRLRDEKDNLKCISCNYDFKDYSTEQPRQAHASHYRPATNSKLRFDERNVWRSCSICNNILSGNLANYRIALIKKIGLKVVEELESENGIYKYSVEEYQEIITKYRAKIKVLQKVT